MKRIMFLLITGILIAPALAMAQDAVNPAPKTETPAALDLDLKTAIALAEKNNFALKGSQTDVDSKRTAAQTSWSIFYPSVSLNGGFSIAATDPTTPSAARNSLSLGLSASLNLTPAMMLNIKRAWNSYESGLATYDQAYATLVNNVKKFYFGLLLLAEQVDNVQKQADAAKQRYDVASFKYKNGFMAEIDMLTVEFAYKGKLSSLTTLQNSYATNLRQLEDVCGIDPAAAVKLTSAIPDVTALNIDFSKYTVDADPDLKILALSKAQAEIVRDTAAASLWPTVTLGGKLGGGYSADPIGTSIFDGASWKWADSVSLSLGVSVPLDAYLPYSQTQNTLMLQNAAVQKLGYSIADQTQNVNRQANTLKLNLQQIRSQLDTLTVNATLARRNLTLTEQLYNSGKKSFLDLKDAENSMADAQFQLISAQNSYLSAVLDLEYIYQADLGL
jgi:cobalt-zinc-cadmium efflux system outer membrane protein